MNQLFTGNYVNKVFAQEPGRRMVTFWVLLWRKYLVKEIRCFKLTLEKSKITLKLIKSKKFLEVLLLYYSYQFITECTVSCIFYKKWCCGEEHQISFQQKKWYGYARREDEKILRSCLVTLRRDEKNVYEASIPRYVLTRTSN